MRTAPEECANADQAISDLPRETVCDRRILVAREEAERSEAREDEEQKAPDGSTGSSKWCLIA